jgi:hypothetical protein
MKILKKLRNGPETNARRCGFCIAEWLFIPPRNTKRRCGTRFLSLGAVWDEIVRGFWIRNPETRPWQQQRRNENASFPGPDIFRLASVPTIHGILHHRLATIYRIAPGFIFERSFRMHASVSVSLIVPLVEKCALAFISISTHQCS